MSILDQNKRVKVFDMSLFNHANGQNVIPHTHTHIDRKTRGKIKDKLRGVQNAKGKKDWRFGQDHDHAERVEILPLPEVACNAQCSIRMMDTVLIGLAPLTDAHSA